MPKEYSRAQRVNSQLLKELSQLINFELKDPRINMVTLTEVQITPDYAHAKVYFTTLNNAENAEEIKKILDQSNGFLRKELGRRIRIHTIPLLHFIFDHSIVRAQALSTLIDKVIAEDSKRQNSQEDSFGNLESNLADDGVKPHQDKDLSDGEF